MILAQGSAIADKYKEKKQPTQFPDIQITKPNWKIQTIITSLEESMMAMLYTTERAL